MKAYTIGILLTASLRDVLLIEKTKPAWQKGKLNFPGGHIEENEAPDDCVAREFEEETGIIVKDWLHIGQIDNPENYTVEVFTAIWNPKMGHPINKTEETVGWYGSFDLPDNAISNLNWLVPFAKNIHQQGNADFLKFGHFIYHY